MIDVKELEMLNRKDCTCGNHQFSLSDINGISFLQDAHGFYGNLVKNYSRVICPVCQNETILLLKQVGQTWDIMNTARVRKQEDANTKENASYEKEDAQMQLTEQTENENKEEKNQSEELICPECKKVCKNKSGLAAHMRTHQNS